MRVLVTGHLGYLGSVMTTVLRHARFDVVGLDCDLYRGCDFGRIHDPVPAFDFDLREVEFTDLLSFDAVIHLAALSDDASGEIDPQLTEAVNYEATVRLAECCKKANVSRFLFASSCSVYGRGGSGPLDERGSGRRLSRYAGSKLRCERALARLADHAFTPVFLRNATVYGVSPRLRLDLVVNDFVGSAVTTGQVKMKTVGSAWRPLIHVEDLARVYAVVLVARDELVHNETFNVVPGDENYRVIDVADVVTEHVPRSTRAVSGGVFDERSYRVDGSKLRRTFPDLRFRWTLPVGIRQLRNAMTNAGLTPGDWRSDRYRRVMRLSRLLESGELSPDLRRAEPVLA
jgi:nucleoside-diphosphate-sugar epimerase